MGVRLVAGLVLAVFVPQTCAWSSGSLGTDVSIPADNKAAFRSVSVPPEFGLASAAFAGKRQERVFGLRDIHESFTAQFSLTELLDNLTHNYSVDLIGVEGMTGDMDLRILTAFPDASARAAVAEEMARQGKLTAAEWFAALHPGRAAVYGVDDEALYWANLAAYQDMIARRPERFRRMDRLMEALDRLEERVYSKDLLDLARHSMSRLGQEGAGFTARWRRISALAGKTGVDESKYAELAKLAEVLELERKVDFAAAEAERDTLMNRLTRELSPKSLEKLVLLGVGFKLGRVSKAALATSVLLQASAAGIDRDAYPHLSAYAAYMGAFEAVDIEKVHDETIALEHAVRSALELTDAEKALGRLHRNMQIVRDIIDVKLTAKGLEEYRARRDDLTERAAADQIRRLTESTGQDLDAAGDAVYLIRELPEAMRFYQLAEDRNRAMLKNLIERMRREGKTSACLVTGGFHTKGIAELMREGSVSHVILTPRFQGGSSRPYEALILQSARSYREFFDSDLAQRTREEAVARLYAHALAGVLRRHARSDADRRQTAVDTVVQGLNAKYRSGLERADGGGPASGDSSIVDADERVVTTVGPQDKHASTTDPADVSYISLASFLSGTKQIALATPVTVSPFEDDPFKLSVAVGTHAYSFELVGEEVRLIDSRPTVPGVLNAELRKKAARIVAKANAVLDAAGDTGRLMTDRDIFAALTEEDQRDLLEVLGLVKVAPGQFTASGLGEAADRILRGMSREQAASQRKEAKSELKKIVKAAKGKPAILKSFMTRIASQAFPTLEENGPPASAMIHAEAFQYAAADILSLYQRISALELEIKNLNQSLPKKPDSEISGPQEDSLKAPNPPRSFIIQTQIFSLQRKVLALRQIAGELDKKSYEQEIKAVEEKANDLKKRSDEVKLSWRDRISNVAAFRTAFRKFVQNQRLIQLIQLEQYLLSKAEGLHVGDPIMLDEKRDKIRSKIDALANADPQESLNLESTKALIDDLFPEGATTASPAQTKSLMDEFAEFRQKSSSLDASAAFAGSPNSALANHPEVQALRNTAHKIYSSTDQSDLGILKTLATEMRQGNYDATLNLDLLNLDEDARLRVIGQLNRLDQPQANEPVLGEVLGELTDGIIDLAADEMSRQLAATDGLLKPKDLLALHTKRQRISAGIGGSLSVRSHVPHIATDSNSDKNQASSQSASAPASPQSSPSTASTSAASSKTFKDVVEDFEKDRRVAPMSLKERGRIWSARALIFAIAIFSWTFNLLGGQTSVDLEAGVRRLAANQQAAIDKIELPRLALTTERLTLAQQRRLNEYQRLEMMEKIRPYAGFSMSEGFKQLEGIINDNNIWEKILKAGPSALRDKDLISNDHFYKWMVATRMEEIDKEEAAAILNGKSADYGNLDIRERIDSTREMIYRSLSQTIELADSSQMTAWEQAIQGQSGDPALKKKWDAARESVKASLMKSGVMNENGEAINPGLPETAIRINKAYHELFHDTNNPLIDPFTGKIKDEGIPLFLNFVQEAVRYGYGYQNSAENGTRIGLKPDQTIMLGLFLAGNSVGLAAGGGKTTVYPLYHVIASHVLGRNYRGMIVVDNEDGAANFAKPAHESNPANPKDYQIPHNNILGIFGMRMVNGSRMHRENNIDGLVQSLNDHNTIVVIGYTERSHIHNLAEMPEHADLKDALNRLTATTADEMHLLAINRDSALLSRGSRRGDPDKVRTMVRLMNRIWDFDKGVVQGGIQPTVLDTEDGFRAAIETYRDRQAGRDQQRVFKYGEEVYVTDAIVQKYVQDGLGTPAQVRAAFRAVMNRDEFNRARGWTVTSVEEEGVTRAVVAPIGSDGSVKSSSIISDAHYQTALAIFHQRGRSKSSSDADRSGPSTTPVAAQDPAPATPGTAPAASPSTTVSAASTSPEAVQATAPVGEDKDGDLVQSVADMVRISDSGSEVAFIDAIHNETGMWILGATGTPQGLEETLSAILGTPVVNINATKNMVTQYQVMRRDKDTSETINAIGAQLEGYALPLQSMTYEDLATAVYFIQQEVEGNNSDGQPRGAWVVEYDNDATVVMQRYFERQGIRVEVGGVDTTEFQELERDASKLHKKNGSNFEVFTGEVDSPRELKELGYKGTVTIVNERGCVGRDPKPFTYTLNGRDKKIGPNLFHLEIDSERTDETFFNQTSKRVKRKVSDGSRFLLWSDRIEERIDRQLNDFLHENNRELLNEVVRKLKPMIARIESQAKDSRSPEEELQLDILSKLQTPEGRSELAKKLAGVNKGKAREDAQNQKILLFQMYQSIRSANEGARHLVQNTMRNRFVVDPIKNLLRNIRANRNLTPVQMLALEQPGVRDKVIADLEAVMNRVLTHDAENIDIGLPPSTRQSGEDFTRAMALNSLSEAETYFRQLRDSGGRTPFICGADEMLGRIDRARSSILSDSWQDSAPDQSYIGVATAASAGSGLALFEGTYRVSLHLARQKMISKIGRAEAAIHDIDAGSASTRMELNVVTQEAADRTASQSGGAGHLKRQAVDTSLQIGTNRVVVRANNPGQNPASFDRAEFGTEDQTPGSAWVQAVDKLYDAVNKKFPDALPQAEPLTPGKKIDALNAALEDPGLRKRLNEKILADLKPTAEYASLMAEIGVYLASRSSEDASPIDPAIQAMIRRANRLLVEAVCGEVCPKSPVTNFLGLAYRPNSKGHAFLVGNEVFTLSYPDDARQSMTVSRIADPRLAQALRTAYRNQAGVDGAMAVFEVEIRVGDGPNRGGRTLVYSRISDKLITAHSLAAMAHMIGIDDGALSVILNRIHQRRSSAPKTGSQSMSPLDLLANAGDISRQMGLTFEEFKEVFAEAARAALMARVSAAMKAGSESDKERSEEARQFAGNLGEERASDEAAGRGSLGTALEAASEYSSEDNRTTIKDIRDTHESSEYATGTSGTDTPKTESELRAEQQIMILHQDELLKFWSQQAGQADDAITKARLLREWIQRHRDETRERILAQNQKLESAYKKLQSCGGTSPDDSCVGSDILTELILEHGLKEAEQIWKQARQTAWVTGDASVEAGWISQTTLFALSSADDSDVDRLRLARMLLGSLTSVSGGADELQKNALVAVLTKLRASSNYPLEQIEIDGQLEKLDAKTQVVQVSGEIKALVEHAQLVQKHFTCLDDPDSCAQVSDYEQDKSSVSQAFEYADTLAKEIYDHGLPAWLVEAGSGASRYLWYLGKLLSVRKSDRSEHLLKAARQMESPRQWETRGAEDLLIGRLIQEKNTDRKAIVDNQELFMTTVLSEALERRRDHDFSLFDEIVLVGQASAVDPKLGTLLGEVFSAAGTDLANRNSAVDLAVENLNHHIKDHNRDRGKDRKLNLVGGLDTSEGAIYIQTNKFRAYTRDKKLTADQLPLRKAISASPEAEAVRQQEEANDREFAIVERRLDSSRENHHPNVSEHRKDGTISHMEENTESWVMREFRLLRGDQATRLLAIIRSDLEVLREDRKDSQNRCQLLQMTASGDIVYRDMVRVRQEFGDAQQILREMTSRVHVTHFSPSNPVKRKEFFDQLFRELATTESEVRIKKVIIRQDLERRFPGWKPADLGRLNPEQMTEFVRFWLEALHEHEVQHHVDSAKGRPSMYQQLAAGDTDKYQHYNEIASHLRSLTMGRAPRAVLLQIVTNITRGSSGAGYMMASIDILERIVRHLPGGVRSGVLREAGVRGKLTRKSLEDPSVALSVAQALAGLDDLTLKVAAEKARIEYLTLVDKRIDPINIDEKSGKAAQLPSMKSMFADGVEGEGLDSDADAGAVISHAKSMTDDQITALESLESKVKEIYQITLADEANGQMFPRAVAHLKDNQGDWRSSVFAKRLADGEMTEEDIKREIRGELETYESIAPELITDFKGDEPNSARSGTSLITQEQKNIIARVEKFRNDKAKKLEDAVNRDDGLSDKQKDYARRQIQKLKNPRIAFVGPNALNNAQFYTEGRRERKGQTAAYSFNTHNLLVVPTRDPQSPELALGLPARPMDAAELGRFWRMILHETRHQLTDFRDERVREGLVELLAMRSAYELQKMAEKESGGPLSPDERVYELVMSDFESKTDDKYRAYINFVRDRFGSVGFAAMDAAQMTGDYRLLGVGALQDTVQRAQGLKPAPTAINFHHTVPIDEVRNPPKPESVEISDYPRFVARMSDRHRDGKFVVWKPKDGPVRVDRIIGGPDRIWEPLERDYLINGRRILDSMLTDLDWEDVVRGESVTFQRLKDPRAARELFGGSPEDGFDYYLVRDHRHGHGAVGIAQGRLGKTDLTLTDVKIRPFDGLDKGSSEFFQNIQQRITAPIQRLDRYALSEEGEAFLVIGSINAQAHQEAAELIRSRKKSGSPLSVQELDAWYRKRISKLVKLHNVNHGTNYKPAFPALGYNLGADGLNPRAGNVVLWGNPERNMIHGNFEGSFEDGVYSIDYDAAVQIGEDGPYVTSDLKTIIVVGDATRQTTRQLLLSEEVMRIQQSALDQSKSKQYADLVLQDFFARNGIQKLSGGYDSHAVEASSSLAGSLHATSEDEKGEGNIVLESDRRGLTTETFYADRRDLKTDAKGRLQERIIRWYRGPADNSSPPSEISLTINPDDQDARSLVDDLVGKGLVQFDDDGKIIAAPGSDSKKSESVEAELNRLRSSDNDLLKQIENSDSEGNRVFFMRGATLNKADASDKLIIGEDPEDVHLALKLKKTAEAEKDRFEVVRIGVVPWKIEFADPNNALKPPMLKPEGARLAVDSTEVVGIAAQIKWMLRTVRSGELSVADRVRMAGDLVRLMGRLEPVDWDTVIGRSQTTSEAVVDPSLPLTDDQRTVLGQIVDWYDRELANEVAAGAAAGFADGGGFANADHVLPLTGLVDASGKLDPAFRLIWQKAGDQLRPRVHVYADMSMPPQELRDRIGAIKELDPALASSLVLFDAATLRDYAALRDAVRQKIAGIGPRGAFTIALTSAHAPTGVWEGDDSEQLLLVEEDDAGRPIADGGTLTAFALAAAGEKEKIFIIGNEGSNWVQEQASRNPLAKIFRLPFDIVGFLRAARLALTQAAISA